ncbi:hypothetical protein HK100_011722 [Physocladia obscura]|uniref:BZIP domain-containing protein n=1 Tax=Physocladia obscura TaxID=109957 RepID=A0AAD5TA26_9FUNG|nr:hypothetical protein HK100_011722 [Physocladia obscura]
MNNESEHKRRKRERSTSTHNEDDGGNESDLEGASDDSGNNNTSSNRKIAGSKLGTSSPSGSNSASTPAISANKPRSKPGRKRTDVPADDKRTAQNRIAQRAFRDRKLQYVKDLETRVQQLSAIVEGNPEFVALKETTDLRNRISELEHQLLLGSNSASESQCENCTQLQQQNDQLAARNAIYENNLAQQQHEYNILKQIVMGSNNLNNDMNYSNNNQNNNSNNDDNNNDLYAQILNNNQPNNVVLAPLLASTPSAISSESPFLQASTAQLALLSSGMLEEMSFSPSSSNILSDESYDPAHDNAFTSASELFGTMYVDAHRTALKQVSSISKCPHVDEMMDTLLVISLATIFLNPLNNLSKSIETFGLF